MIALESHAEGALLPVQARAGGRRNELKAAANGSLHVSVTQTPEKGKANKAIIALLAERLSLRKSQIELVSGATSPQKRFLVRQIAAAELAARIKAALAR
ncbi:MAG: DUF167 domain-containing protein [Planctomycetota bacterium]|nr:MAG: DUF167 domain-containing protein [Planctomycetota bacterium]